MLLLDEPTASLTEHETAALFALLRRLRDDGVAIVFVSHKLEEVFALATASRCCATARTPRPTSRWLR